MDRLSNIISKSACSRVGGYSSTFGREESPCLGGHVTSRRLREAEKRDPGNEVAHTLRASRSNPAGHQFDSVKVPCS